MIDLTNEPELDWSLVRQDAAVERERAKRLVIQARQQGIRVRCIKPDELYRTRGWSKTEHRIKDHDVKVSASGQLLCDCTWGQRQSGRYCTHTAPVEAYRRRKAKEAARKAWREQK